MGSRVLVTFDDSDPAQRALEHAIETFPDTDITVLTVVGEVGSVDDTEDLCHEDDDGAYADLADERLTFAEDIAAEHGVSIRTECEVGRRARRSRSTPRPRTPITSSSPATAGPGSRGSTSGASPRTSLERHPHP